MRFRRCCTNLVRGDGKLEEASNRIMKKNEQPGEPASFIHYPLSDNPPIPQFKITPGTGLNIRPGIMAAGKFLFEQLEIQLG